MGIPKDGGPDRAKYMKEYLIAGSIAGVVSRTCIAPIERVKILFQISKASSAGRRGYLHYVPEIYQTEGVRAFWRGNSVAVIRVVPYMSITFLSYEQYKATLQMAGFSANPCNLLAGSAAGMTAVVTTYPLDLVRARLAKQQTGLKSFKYKNMWDALINIPREEGRQTGDGRVRIQALYCGLAATMVGEAPYAGLKFCMYEAMKRALGDVWGKREEELSPIVRVSCGALSGLMAVNVVYPFDVVRRRMQTHEGAKALYKTPFHAIARIVQEEGVVKGLYRGLTLNYIKTLPNVAIYMSLYDVVKNSLVARAKALEARQGQAGGGREESGSGGGAGPTSTKHPSSAEHSSRQLVLTGHAPPPDGAARSRSSCIDSTHGGGLSSQAPQAQGMREGSSEHIN